MAKSSEKVQIRGTCEPSYAPVRDKLEQMLRKGSEDNVQLCVYVDGKCVVDLAGTAKGNSSYNEESLQTIYSSGKSLESVVMGMLYDKGLFKFEDKITQFWPEFGQNGKDDVRICDVLRHEAGLAWFTESIPTVKDAFTENIKLNKIGQHIEKQKQHFPENAKLEYHALTRGLIINEVVRRVDPKGRTIGEIYREDVKIDGVYNGLKDEEISKTCPVIGLSDGYVTWHSLLPKWAGKRLDLTFGQLMAMSKAVKALKVAFGERPTVFSEQIPGFETDKFVSFFNAKETRKAEVSSANMCGNARGCAKLASIMANKGQGLMSEQAWQELHSEPTLVFCGELGVRTNFTKAGLNYFVEPEDATEPEKHGFIKNREGFYGWFGYGGSVIQWHPELKIGFAFIPTMAIPTEFYCQRGAKLQQLVKDCARKCSN